MRRSISPSLLRRAAVTAGLVVLTATVFAGQASAMQPASGPHRINTYRGWDHSTYISSFGCPNTTTYGQTITATARNLKSFTFYVENLNSGSMVLRGEVYAWNGTMATGDAVFESKPITINYNDGQWHPIKIRTGRTKIDKGADYVLFLSIDKDFEQCQDNYALAWAATDDTAYPGGTFVFQNNGGDESQWTTAPWNTVGLDSAFKAVL